MASEKISQMPDGTPLVSTDIVPIVRAGANESVKGSSIERTTNKDVAGGYPGLSATGFMNPAELPLLLAMTFPFLNMQLAQVIELTNVPNTDGGSFLYTVPAGMRAVVDLWGVASTPAGDTVFLEVQINGVWYQASTNGSAAGNQPSRISGLFALSTTNLIFEAGDVISCRGITGNAAQVYGAIYTFSTAYPVKAPRVVGTLPLGDNVLYTVPAGKRAAGLIITVQPSGQTPTGGDFLTSLGVIGANSAGTPVYTVYRLGTPSSPENGLTRLILPAAKNVGAGSVTLPGYSALSAGGSLVLKLLGGNNILQLQQATPAGANTQYGSSITGGAGTVLTLSAAANAVGGNTVYTGTITGGTGNALVGKSYTVAGFTNGNNNSVANTCFVCVASTLTTLTLANPNGVAETHSGGATPNNYVGSQFMVDGFVNTSNNGQFTCIASNNSTLVLNNPNGISEALSGGRAVVYGFAVSSVAAAVGGSTTYTGVFTGAGTGNNLSPWNVIISGCANPANNGTFQVSASSATSITVNNPNGVAESENPFALAQLVSLPNQLVSVGYVVEM